MRLAALAVAALLASTNTFSGSAEAQTAGARDVPVFADDWYDRGPGCASVRPGKTKDEVILRLWYCEAGIEAAQALRMYKTADGTFAHPSIGLRFIPVSSTRMRIILTAQARRKLDDQGNVGLYVAEDDRVYER